MKNGNIAEALLNYRPPVPSESRPTVEQIAIIAATLARNSEKDTPDKLADRAMKQWLAARARIYIADEERELSKQDIELLSKFVRWHVEKDYFLPTGEYPLKRDLFLQKMLPQYKSRPDVLKRYGMGFLSYALRDVKKRKPTPDEIAKVYANFPSFKNADQANAWASYFEEWHCKHIKDVRRAAGKKGAKKRRKARPPVKNLKMPY
jgi:hypothetical protein